MDLIFVSAVGFILLLTVLISVMVYVSRSILDGPKSKRQKTLLVLGLAAVLLIVGFVGASMLMSPFASAFD